MSTPLPCLLNIYLDSDGVVCDFDAALARSGLSVEVFKHQPGTYLWLDIMPGATESLNILKALDDEDKLRVWILTKTPSRAPYAYTEKVLWYRQHFPWLEDRVILTQDKHLMGTERDILLDDRPHKANADKFRGEFMLFDPLHSRDGWAALIQTVKTRLFHQAFAECEFKKE